MEPFIESLTFDDLILSFHTMRHATFASRVQAAAVAGFRGIGMSGAGYERLLAGGGERADLGAIVRDHGVPVLELEALRGWDAAGAAGEQSRVSEELFYDMSEVLGPAHHLQAIGSIEGDLDHAGDAFGALCDRAAEHGLLVALEFIPEFTNIPDVATAHAIVERADRPNGGLCVDIWHYLRGPSNESQLRTAADRVFAVQLDDGPLAPSDDDYLTDTMSNRVAPGEGEFDVVGFIDALAASGVSRPISVEVISLELDLLPPDEVADRVARGTRAVLERWRSQSGIRPETI